VTIKEINQPTKKRAASAANLANVPVNPAAVLDLGWKMRACALWHKLRN
jgi:hypothetical protein